MEEQAQMAPQAPQGNDEVYPVATLVARAEQIFGQPHFVVQGAISRSNLSGNVSLAQVKQAVDEFLAQKDTRHPEG